MEADTEEHKYVNHALLSSMLSYLDSATTHAYRSLACLLRLVLETLSPLPQDRKCFRMINGVLVERTVKDVLPALETNSAGLKKVLDELVKQYKRQQEEMEKWKVSVTLFPLLLLSYPAPTTCSSLRK